SIGILRLHVSSHHLSLPSFPTRRSSDLHTSDCSAACMRIFGSTGTLNADMQTCMCQRQVSVAAAPSSGTYATTGSGGLTLTSSRSEEHTSELQSPYDLVCRLLLEKKKEY